MVKKAIGLAMPGTSVEPAAVVVDLSNFQFNGSGRHGRLDLGKVAVNLGELGVEQGVVLAEAFYPKEVARLRRWGLRAIATKTNSDDVVLAYAARFLKKYNKLYALTGDGELGLRILAEARPGQEVEVWAHSARLSQRLWAAAPRVRFIDHWVAIPRRNDWAALAARTPALSQALH